jgi:hypothetical protein
MSKLTLQKLEPHFLQRRYHVTTSNYIFEAIERCIGETAERIEKEESEKRDRYDRNEHQIFASEKSTLDPC